MQKRLWGSGVCVVRLRRVVCWCVIRCVVIKKLLEVEVGKSETSKSIQDCQNYCSTSSISRKRLFSIFLSHFECESGLGHTINSLKYDLLYCSLVTVGCHCALLDSPHRCSHLISTVQ